MHAGRGRRDPFFGRRTGRRPERRNLAKAPTQVKILVPGSQPMVALLGQRDELLKLVEAAFDSQILVRGNEITVTGPEGEADKVGQLFEELLELLSQGHVLTESSVGQTIALVKHAEARPSEVLGDRVLTGRGRTIGPRTLGQKRYVDALRKATVTFAIGPAGTGKTYLAVATAVKALQEQDVRRIILTRPAVEAGERLGFLPGTLYEKIDPDMKPLYDALYEMMDADALQRMMERGTIEVAPLGFMRGRTLNDSFIILDEGQNTSPEQMKMFLTRLGFGSRAVVNGDVTQVDLPAGQRSGLSVVGEILSDIEGIEFIHLGARDVVRHKIVQDIVEAYRRFGEQRATAD
jgi:phosphate starvation-inducible PhoH-like protein